MKNIYKFRKSILKIAKKQVNKLKKKYPLNNPNLKIKLDNVENAGGFVNFNEKDIIYLCTNFYKNKPNLKYEVKRIVTHEYCHNYIRDKNLKEYNTFQVCIKNEIMKIFLEYGISINKFNLEKYIGLSISDYAQKHIKTKSMNAFEEVLCDAFFRYNCYNYKENKDNLLDISYIIHKGLVDLLIDFKPIKKDKYYIDEIDLFI